MLFFPQWEDLWNPHLCISMSTHGKQVALYFVLTGFVERSLELFQILVRNTNENIFQKVLQYGEFSFGSHLFMRALYFLVHRLWNTL